MKCRPFSGFDLIHEGVVLRKNANLLASACGVEALGNPLNVVTWLSRNVVLNHSWDAVREILLHEMAHQFAEQVLGASNEPPHGPKFKRGCYLLRANPSASGNYRPLDELIFDDSTGPEDKIMVRVKKLMALARSKNQHGAEAAMAKAHDYFVFERRKGFAGSMPVQSSGPIRWAAFSTNR